MTEFFTLRPKIYIHLRDDNDENKKVQRSVSSNENLNLKIIKIVQRQLQKLVKSNKLILESQHKLRSEKYNVFIEEVKEIALNTKDDKRIQSIDSMETYVYGRSKDLIRKYDEIKCNNIRKQYEK